ncbi:MAG: agmatinase [Phycisphaerae bacterium]|nr:agmatinase [Phycisphaerae bacterium]
MTDSLPLNFLGLPASDADYRRARYVVWPVPYDATVSFRTGSREGPLAIIAASRQTELFDPQLGREIHQPGVATLDFFEPDVSSAEATMNALFRRAKKLVADGKFLLTLGGEHSISSPIIRAHKPKFKGLSVLHIDAHLDMRAAWQNSPFSHACIIRRVHEMGIPTVSVGIRNVSQEEHRYLKKSGATVVFGEQVHRDREGSIRRAIEALSDQVYLTIDMDGFDPAYAPGTGTPEPGGLDWYAVNDLLTEIARTRTIVGADIVETMPAPGQVVTEFLASKLAVRIIALTQMFEKRGRGGK